MSQNLSEEQRGILSYFEGLEEDFQESGINEIYLKGSQQAIAEPCSGKWLSYPITEQIEFEPQYQKLREKLNEYKKRSKLVQEVGNLVYEYQLNFHHMLDKREELKKLIEDLNKETSQLVQKQKNYIDLSMAVKQSLDYYSYLDRFQFNWVCEISCRDMFEDRLQPILSELTDAIEFFSTNINYSSAKKYLSGLAANRTKVMSFTKSFFIKIFNKQYTFSLKNSKPNIWAHIDNFYPKSKGKFLTDFLSIFPQFKKNLKLVLLSAKEAATEEEIAQLETKEYEIEQFELNQSSLSLIGYLQTSIPEIYEEAVLKFISFYRVSLHENLHKTLQFNPTVKFNEAYRDLFTQSVYILTAEAAYLTYIFRPSSEAVIDFTKTTVIKIAEFYSNLLVKVAKDPARNKDPFSLCNQINFCLDESDKFFRNYLSKQYQTYALGPIIRYLEELGVEFMKEIVEGIGKRVKHELETACQNFLPKFKLELNREKLTQQVRQFIDMIPNLKYCPGQAEKYLVSSLDIIIKSVKEVNSRIESRMECYAWDIEIFAAIEDNLSQLPYHLVKKQMRLDMNETTSIFENLKGVNRDQNLLKYASDLLSVIKTGVPTLNELTLDFNKFVREYHQELRSKFTKDMVFVHAKNVIEFLQKLKDSTPENAAAAICNFSLLKNLQEGYLLSMENYIKQGKAIIESRKQFALHSDGQRQLMKLMEEVQQILLDLLSTLYIQTSKHCSETDKFQPIASIKERLGDLWNN